MVICRKILISVVMLTLAIGCGEKEEQVVTTEHVGGSLYVNKRMPKSEYEAMTKKRDSLEREFSQPRYYNEPINIENFEKMDMINVNYEIGFWLFVLFFFNLLLLTVFTASSKPEDS